MNVVLGLARFVFLVLLLFLALYIAWLIRRDLE